MIVANLATYPPRRARLAKVVSAVAPQVDRLNIVLNGYDTVPDELPRVKGVVPILPPQDMKDVGKFFPDTNDTDYVLLIDDDIDYPADYVERSLAALEGLGEGRFLGGYHGTIYLKRELPLSLRKIKSYFRLEPALVMKHRTVLKFVDGLSNPVVVDQIGSGTAVLRGRDMPPYAFMRDAQMFVDVRLARWCFENGIEVVCLPRDTGWLTEQSFEEQIYNFTRQFPMQVAREVSTFAFRNPRRGARPSTRPV